MALPSDRDGGALVSPARPETAAIGDRDGDRDGGLLYRLSTRAGAFALAQHEAIAVDWISLAIRDCDDSASPATRRPARPHAQRAAGGSRTVSNRVTPAAANAAATSSCRPLSISTIRAA